MSHALRRLRACHPTRWSNLTLVRSTAGTAIVSQRPVKHEPGNQETADAFAASGFSLCSISGKDDDVCCLDSRISARSWFNLDFPIRKYCAPSGMVINAGCILWCPFIGFDGQARCLVDSQNVTAPAKCQYTTNFFLAVLPCCFQAFRNNLPMPASRRGVSRTGHHGDMRLPPCR